MVSKRINAIMKKVTFLFLLVSGFAFSQKSEILKVMKNQQTEWNNGNLEGFMNGYWKSDSLMFVGSNGVNYGWQETLDHYKKSYPSREKMGTLEFSGIKVKPLGKNYASVFGEWKLIRKENSLNGIYTLLFQNFKDGWKIISDHTQ
jgi:hypothetical protein